ncbi:MAG: fasciclin domain-containing protein [Geminicoccaceae bacterium]
MTIRRFLLVLFVSFGLFACGGGSQQPLPQEAPDLVDVLKSRPSLKQFAAAVETTGVAAALQGGSFTIFAPTDVAVAKSEAGSLDEATIKHHILPERVTFSDLAGEIESYTTLHTDEIEVDATEAIRIGEGLMVESDIAASNGVIHVIDTVLAPGDVPTNLTPTTLTNPAAGEAVVPTAPQ